MVELTALHHRSRVSSPLVFTVQKLLVLTSSMQSYTVWQQRSHSENVGESLTASEFVFQLRSAPTRWGLKWCSATSALQKSVLAHVRKPTGFLTLPVDGQPVPKRVWGRHLKSIPPVHSNAYSQHTWLLFLSFFNVSSTLPSHSLYVHKVVTGERLWSPTLRLLCGACRPYLLQPHLLVASAAGRWRRKAETAGAKEPPGSSRIRWFQQRHLSGQGCSLSAYQGAAPKSKNLSQKRLFVSYFICKTAQCF